MTPRPTVFLDRDGVLTIDQGLVTNLNQVEIVPDSQRALKQLKDLGFSLILISNQSVVARGLLSEEDCAHLNEEILNRACGESWKEYFSDIHLCFFHPDAQVTKYRSDSLFRKPNHGALEYFIERYQIDREKSFMVGDRESDVIAGNRAQLSSVLIGAGAEKIKYFKPIEENEKIPNYQFDSLLEFSFFLKRSFVKKRIE